MDHHTVAISVVKTLQQGGFTAYFAGGWVRDFLMKHPSDDIDIATDASVEEVQALFEKTIPVGVQFGIVIVVKEGHQFEVATFRKDQEYKDGRRPIGIERASPEEDAKRRDFTINGMFYDPLTERVYDYVKGQEDIKRGLIRAIGDPHERFLEDRLRMIRAIRYASRFNFEIDPQTLEAILDHAPTLFPAVAIERIWNELTKMAAFSNFDQALVSLHKLNLLPLIFPSLEEVSHAEIEQRVRHLSEFPSEAPVIAKILELFPDKSLEDHEALCSYLKLSNDDLRFIRFYAQAKTLFLEKENHALHVWAHFYAHPSYPLLLKIASLYYSKDKRADFLKKHQRRQQKLQWAIDKIQNRSPFLTAAMLRERGIPDGPQMGALLRQGEALAIDYKLSTPEEILNKLLS